LEASTAPSTAADLTGKTALVTGATSGIGKAAALTLADHGATVLVHGRDAERGTRVGHQIEQGGGHARFVAADLSDPAAVAQLAGEVGRIDILVNNAGSSWFGPSNELDTAGYDRLFDGNVRSAYLLTAALAPAMAGNGGGVIIKLASMAATIGLPGGAAYSATKAALVAMTRSWAAEYGGSGVRVNAVAPCPVFTEGAKTHSLSPRPLCSTAPHNPKRSSRPSPSWLHSAPPTSRAPPSPSMVAELQSDAKLLTLTADRYRS